MNDIMKTDVEEAALLGMRADIDGIDHLRLQIDIGFRCHGCLLSLFSEQTVDIVGQRGTVIEVRDYFCFTQI